jgi:endo-1,4-beta-xylanase
MRGFLVGAALKSWMVDPSAARSAGLVTPDLDLIKSEFNILTPEVEMKWESIQPKAPRFNASGTLVPAPDASRDFNLGPADKLVRFASENGFAVHGHTLLYSSTEPPWLTGCTGAVAGKAKCATPWTVDQLRQILKYHVQTLVAHYKRSFPNVPILWDLVNEPNSAVSEYLGGAPTNRTSVFEQIPDPATGKPSTTYYLILAANYALQADPGVNLCINDSFIEDLDSYAARNMFSLARTLQQAGVPLDCVGFETHQLLDSFDGSTKGPSKQTMLQTMQRYAGLGLKVLISEMDVALPLVGQGTSPAPQPQPSASAPHYWDAQARMYSDVMSACLESLNCIGFITWNFNPVDSYLSSTRSWGIARYGLPKGYSSDALPFDASNRPKPAYDAMRDALVSAVRPAGFSKAGRLQIAPGKAVSIPIAVPAAGLQDIHVIAAACASSGSDPMKSTLRINLDRAALGTFPLRSPDPADYALQAPVTRGTHQLAFALSSQAPRSVCVDRVWFQPSAPFSDYLIGYQFNMTGSGYRWAGDQRVTLTKPGAALITSAPVAIPISGTYEFLWSGWASLAQGGKIELDVDDASAASFAVTDTQSGGSFYQDYRVLLKLTKGPHSIRWVNQSAGGIQITMDHLLILSRADGSIYMPARGMRTAPGGSAYRTEAFTSSGAGFQDTVTIPTAGTYQISVTSASHQIVSSAGDALSDYGQGEVFVDGISIGKFTSPTDAWNVAVAGKPIPLSAGAHSVRVVTTNLTSQSSGFVNQMSMAIQSVTVTPVNR